MGHTAGTTTPDWKHQNNATEIFTFKGVFPAINPLGVDDFVAATTDLCGFPSFFNAPLFQRIRAMFGDGPEDAEAQQRREAKGSGAADTPSAQLVTHAMFCRFWRADSGMSRTAERARGSFSIMS